MLGNPARFHKLLKIFFATSSKARNFDVAFRSLKKFVLDRLPCRPVIVAHHVTTSEAEMATIRKSFAAVSKSLHLRFEDDPILSDEELKMNVNISGAATTSGMKGNLLQWQSLKKCAEMVDEAAQVEGPPDCVIWARPDLFYFTSIEKIQHLDMNRIYFPTHDQWGGYNDRLSFGSFDFMQKRMRIYDYFMQTWYAREHAIRPNWNPEAVLKDLIDHEYRMPVSYTKVVFGKLRKDHVSCPSWGLQGLRSSPQPISYFLKIPKWLYIKKKLHARSYEKENIKGFPLDKVTPMLP